MPDDAEFPPALAFCLHSPSGHCILLCWWVGKWILPHEHWLESSDVRLQPCHWSIKVLCVLYTHVPAEVRRAGYLTKSPASR